MRHFDHGYAVTSHSSQGLTSERVLVNMDTNVHPELISTRFAYVSVSRASQDAQIYTNDAATLAESLSRDVTKASAIDFGKAQSPVAKCRIGAGCGSENCARCWPWIGPVTGRDIACNSVSASGNGCKPFLDKRNSSVIQNESRQHIEESRLRQKSLCRLAR